MIEPHRVQALNDRPQRKGKYVLYWMQASQRAEGNHALEHAIARANAMGLPLVVGFGLTDDYPDANLRHYAFMLQGLADARQALAGRGIRLVVRRGQPAEVALALAGRAALLVCDRGYLRHQRQWRQRVATEARCSVVQVEADAVVPVEAASDRDEFAARTLRPKIHKLLGQYLRPLEAVTLQRDSMGLRLASDIDLDDLDAALVSLQLDRSVPQSSRFTGGTSQARAALARFCREKLGQYAIGRNEPAAAGTSTLSPYLHFGQISPLQVALAVRDHAAAPGADREAYLEELIVRRELSVNHVFYNPRYDQYEGLPEWARRTLSEHRNDKRPYVYTRQQLEAAHTHDPYWNAAQLEMTKTGFMHNYMRMYWGKKILEWTRAPREAFETTLSLNNRYFLDGRDPNAYANVAWIYGLHDRPWGPARPIFGTVRYMNAAGLERKFDIDAYVRWVDSLER